MPICRAMGQPSLLSSLKSARLAYERRNPLRKVLYLGDKKKIPINTTNIIRRAKSVESPPPSNPSSGDSVGKLLEGIEKHDEGKRSPENQVIGLDERQQFFRLSQLVEVEIKDSHNDAQEYGYQQIGEQAVFQFASRLFLFATTVERPDDGRESVGETQSEDDGEVEQRIHKAGCRKFRSTVVPDHHGVGESQDDGAQLSDHDGDPEIDKFFVVSFVADGLVNLASAL